MRRTISFRSPDELVGRYQRFAKASGLSKADTARVAFSKGLALIERHGIQADEAELRTLPAVLNGNPEVLTQ